MTASVCIAQLLSVLLTLWDGSAVLGKNGLQGLLARLEDFAAGCSSLAPEPTHTSHIFRLYP